MKNVINNTQQVVIEICSLRTTKLEFTYDVRVDRLSILGNPFKMDSESRRDLVCNYYRDYFLGMINNNVLKLAHVPNERLPRFIKLGFVEFRKEFMDELRRLYKILATHGKLRLFCWCAPKRCHAETIAKFLANYFKNCIIK